MLEGNMGNQNENNENPSNRGSKNYVVYVDDNFHHKDESERYKLGEFSSCEEATEACKKIVDELFNRTFDENVTYEELYSGYTMFGEDPFIISKDRDCFFSAWDYAKKRCRELVARD